MAESCSRLYFEMTPGAKTTAVSPGGICPGQAPFKSLNASLPCENAFFLINMLQSRIKDFLPI